MMILKIEYPRVTLYDPLLFCLHYEFISKIRAVLKEKIVVENCVKA